MSEILKATPYNNGSEAPADQLTRTTAQLRALLVSLTGEGFTSFKSMNEKLQEDLLWLADGLADQICTLVDQVTANKPAAP